MDTNFTVGNVNFSNCLSDTQFKITAEPSKPEKARAVSADDMKQLSQLAQPLINLIKKNGNPYMKIIISDSGAKVVEDVYCVIDEEQA